MSGSGDKEGIAGGFVVVLYVIVNLSFEHGISFFIIENVVNIPTFLIQIWFLFAVFPIVL